MSQGISICTETICKAALCYKPQEQTFLSQGKSNRRSILCSEGRYQSQALIFAQLNSTQLSKGKVCGGIQRVKTPTVELCHLSAPPLHHFFKEFKTLEPCHSVISQSLFISSVEELNINLIQVVKQNFGTLPFSESPFLRSDSPPSASFPSISVFQLAINNYDNEVDCR